VDENDIGWHLVPGDVDLLEATLLTIYERRAELEGIGGRSRQAAEKDYSLDLALERYKAALS